MFNKLKSGAAKLGQDIKVAAGEAKEYTLNTIDKQRLVLDNFKTGNVVILVSRSSGKALQKVSPTELNGKGETDQENAKWSVLDLGDHTCRLHNGGDFLGIENGETKLFHFDNPEDCDTEETVFKLKNSEQFVSFESTVTAAHHVGILGDGDVKPALATGTENDSHFAVQLTHNNHPGAEAKVMF